jgi:DNA-binding PadR family transcriptional regulator
MTQEMIRGHLDMLVLSIVDDGPTHGYAVVAELRRRTGGDFDLPEGTVYPALYRLERAKLLSSGWSEMGGRRRRVYRLTRSGRKALAVRRAEWAAFSRNVASVIGVAR